MTEYILIAGILFSPAQVCDAIGLAEHSKAHPYGIMERYSHTSPKDACINTVKHKWSNWVHSRQETPFLPYLASKYAPLAVANDPKGLNKHWEKNVLWFLTHKERNR